MKFFLFLSLFLLVSQETLDDYDVEYEENYKVCSSLVDETICLNKVLESNIFYCCYVSSDVPESNSCVVTDKANLEIFKNEKLTALYRESNGYEDEKNKILRMVRIAIIYRNINVRMENLKQILIY